MPLKVYYLDDEEALCENFIEYFASDLVLIKTFTDPIQAIKDSKENPPDIFFIDYRLPETTGDEVARTLDESIPKYLITGDIYVKSEYKFIKIFTKPCSPVDIQQIIDGYLKKSA